MCVAPGLLGGGSDTSCPREGTPSHVSQLGDVDRVGSEGDAGAARLLSEFRLAWLSGRCGSQHPGRGLESRTPRPWDMFGFLFPTGRSALNPHWQEEPVWDRLPPPPARRPACRAFLRGVLWGRSAACPLPASCGSWGGPLV